LQDRIVMPGNRDNHWRPRGDGWPVNEEIREQEADDTQNREPRQGGADAGRGSTSGRDKPPANRRRDPNSPWLGGG
jgi:hypothetical protein